MKRIGRKTTPKAVRGKARSKKTRARTPNYYHTPEDAPAIDRHRPGRGYRHVLMKRHVIDFISILPNWAELSRGLNTIVLGRGEPDTAGRHYPGVVIVCACERDLWQTVDAEFFEEHQGVYDRLEVDYERLRDGSYGYVVRFTEAQMRAYQLFHVLLGELGRHHDRGTTRSEQSASGEEGYAEQYALKYADVIWERYREVFLHDGW